ncbi:uncharacterized protein LOC133195738 [Saccostrea echinata]|uniref:uncharacterized protein LOC133195738 n=1 Tax=Saccostrea echinata TaxID=191078 RepID=UPI002A831675|nr:uncharacterized protein LOC133195738 [Saccostrea echinata]
MENRNFLPYSPYADGISPHNQSQQNENFVKPEYQGSWESNIPYTQERYHSGQNQFLGSGYGSIPNNYYPYPTHYPQPETEYREYGANSSVNMGYPPNYGMSGTHYPGPVPLNHTPNSFSTDHFVSQYYPNTGFNYQSQVFNNNPYLGQPQEDSSNCGKYKTSNKPLAKPYTKSNQQESPSLPPDPYYGNWAAIVTPEDSGKSEKTVPQTILNFERDNTLSDIGNALLHNQRVLCENLQGLNFDEPVAHVYCPSVYAFETYKEFVRKYCRSEKKVLFVGINPGPWGMVQSGVPFGDGTFVRDWLEIQGNILRPAWEHPKRPILGLDCTRSEVSGKKLWTLIKSLCGQPDNFFEHCFLHNICPLSFLSKTGSNITPPDILPAEKRNQLNQICDSALTDVIRLLKVEVVVAIGRYVETCVKNVMKNGNLHDFRVEYLAHPSPLNRKAGNRWSEIAEEQLKEFGVLSYIKTGNGASGIKPEFSESEASEQDSFTDNSIIGQSPSLKTFMEKELPAEDRNPYSQATIVKQEPTFGINCVNQTPPTGTSYGNQEPNFDSVSTRQFPVSCTAITEQSRFSETSYAEPFSRADYLQPEGGSVGQGIPPEFGIINQGPPPATGITDHNPSSQYC